MKKPRYLFLSLLILIIIGIGYFSYKNYNLKPEPEVIEGYWAYNDYLFKSSDSLEQKNIDYMVNYFNKVHDLYFEDKQVYYALIPDKQYYLEGSNDKSKEEFKTIEDAMKHGLTNFYYIDIKNDLDLQSFYKTDPHWRQESLDSVVKTIGTALNFTYNDAFNHYTENTYNEFYGSYYWQSEIDVPKETLVYKSNDIMDNVIRHNFDMQQTDQDVKGVYDPSKLNEKGGYDVFLSGLSPLMTIENPESTSDEELIIFRDSFGSSLTPLLVESYKKITLIDLRFIPYKALSEFISFNGDEQVLFLYNETLIRNSFIFR